MSEVILQFSAMDDAGSWIIREYEHGDWSHVDIVMPNGELLGARNDVFENTPAGVQIRSANYAVFSRTKRVSLSCPDTQAFYDFLASQIGKGYDEAAILGFVIDRDWRDPCKWFCSELAAAAFEASLILTHKIATTENKVTPGDLFLICSVLTDVTG